MHDALCLTDYALVRQSVPMCEDKRPRITIRDEGKELDGCARHRFTYILLSFFPSVFGSHSNVSTLKTVKTKPR